MAKQLFTKEQFNNDIRRMYEYKNAQGIKFQLDLGKIEEAGYDYILKYLSHGVTILKAKGGYLGEKENVNGEWAAKDENEYIVFDSNQFKNIDNTNPTTNPDIRYSIEPTQDNQGRELSKEQQEYFKER